MFVAKAPTVDAILSTFTKALSDLEALVSRKQTDITDNRIKIGTLEAENVASSTEITRAEAAAKAIKAIVG